MIFRLQIQRTLALAFVFSLVSGSLSYYVQQTANNRVTACSYLDPISIDIFALAAGLFLIVEGFIDIFGHKDLIARKQLTRIIRISFGVSIVTIHIMQFMHK